LERRRELKFFWGENFGERQKDDFGEKNSVARSFCYVFDFPLRLMGS
jgi:hypothetical protein